MTVEWLVRRLRLPPRRIVLWHSVAALPMTTLVVVGAVLSWHYHSLTEANRVRIERGYQLLDGVQRQFALVEDAAIAERDYVITGDDAVLRPFRQAVTTLQPALRALTPLVQGQVEETRRLAAIDEEIAARLDEFGEVVRVRREEGFEPARALVARSATVASTGALRLQVATLASMERGRLADQQSAGRVHERHVVWSGVAIAGVSILVRIAIALWMRRMRPAQDVPML